MCKTFATHDYFSTDFASIQSRAENLALQVIDLQTSLKHSHLHRCELWNSRENRWQLINWLIAVTNVNSYVRY